MRRLTAILVLLLSSACGQQAPSPPTTPNPGGSETITGRERIGWDQQADSTDELASFGYAIFVDGNRSLVDGVSCGAAATATGFPCSGRLPAMSGGAHTLELSTFVTRNGETLESSRSASLRVVVSAASPIEAAATVAAGDTVRAVEKTASRAAVVTSGLEQPNDLAIAPDGRVFIAEASGRISIIAGGRRRTALQPVPGTRVEIIALALDPQIARNGFVYVVRVALDTAAPVFQLVRYREVGGTLGEAATLLDNVSASDARPAAALRFGPDGRLYAAFEERDEASAAQGAYNGKILRLNPDGTTPRDQRGGSPVFAAGARRPRGLSWDAGGVLWIVDGDSMRQERLIAAAPVRGPVYTLPTPFGAASAVFHTGGDLLIGAESAGYILRVHFDEGDRTRVAGTERLLQGDVDAVRAIAVAADGTVYVGTSATLINLKSLNRADKPAKER